MNEVEKFISENSHQFGYVMQEASRQWVQKDPLGALTVGTCQGFIDKYGDYHELLEKIEQYEKALKRIAYCEFDGWSGSDVLGKVTDFANKTLKEVRKSE